MGNDYYLFKRGKDYIQKNIDKYGWVEPIIIKETPAQKPIHLNKGGDTNDEKD